MGRRRQRMRRPRVEAHARVGNTREGGRRVQGDTKCVGQCGVKCGESARTRYPVRRWRACGGIEGGEAAQARRDERYERLRSPSGAAHLEGRVCATWDMWQVERAVCDCRSSPKNSMRSETRSLSLARACVSLPQRKVPCKNTLSLGLRLSPSPQPANRP